CYLESRTRDEAARQLGWSLRTLERRLEQGRKLLRARLLRRGVTLSAALFAAALGRSATAAIPALLAVTTVRAAVRRVDTISANVAKLVDEGIQAMGAAKTKVGLALVLTATFLAVGMGMALDHQSPSNSPLPARNNSPAADQPSVESGKPKTDLHDDPLPDGAIARIGTLRFVDGGQFGGLLYTPDGKMLITSGGFVRVWDAATGRQVREWPVKEVDSVNSLALSPDGKTLATGTIGDKPTVRLWDMAT